MANHRTLQINFGTAESAMDLAGGGVRLNVASPHLHGPAMETLFGGACELIESDGLATLASGGTLCGAGVFSFSGDPAAQTALAYRAVFRAIGGALLHRVWHYVPGINSIVDGMEVYHHFSKGRAMAFEEEYQDLATSRMCAASAVGVGGTRLAIAFLASRATPCHIENPEQIPAYAYPPEYGPRPPSFARASMIPEEQGCSLYLAGTASIKGHQSLWTGDTYMQTQTTLSNMSLVLKSAGIDPASINSDSYGKLYLRNADDLARVLPIIETAFPFLKKNLICLQADICRQELAIEIEATVRTGQDTNSILRQNPDQNQDRHAFATEKSP